MRKIFSTVYFLLFMQFYISAQNCGVVTSSDTACNGQSVVLNYLDSNSMYSMYFDGVNDYVSISNPLKYDFGTTQNFTIDYWIKKNSIPSNTAANWILTKGANSWNPHYQTGVQSGTGYPRISISDGSQAIQLNGSINVCDGSWHHLAFVFNQVSNVIKIYVNGTLNVTASIATVGSISNSQPVSFGCSIQGSNYTSYFQGNLDDVRIWNSELTSTQINNLKTQFINPLNYPNLIGYYDFNEGTGSAVTDCAPNPINGIISSMPIFDISTAPGVAFSFPVVWNTGDTNQTITVFPVGNSVYSASSGWCKYLCSDSITIYDGNNGISVFPDTISLCESAYVLKPSSISNVTWSTGSTADSIFINQSGLYWLAGISGNCTINDTFFVEINNTKLIPISASYTICEDEEVVIKIPQMQNQTVTWFDGSTALIKTFNSAGVFIVKREIPCETLFDSITVIVINCDTIPQDTITRIFIPNVFTPNQIGGNEFFEIKGVGVYMYSIKIFNRWGEMVFESNTLENSWDGTYKNRAVSDGVYAYIVEYRDWNNKFHQEHGMVTVFR